jgi:hypothetical protein
MSEIINTKAYKKYIDDRYYTLDASVYALLERTWCEAEKACLSTTDTSAVKARLGSISPDKTQMIREISETAFQLLYWDLPKLCEREK